LLQAREETDLGLFGLAYFLAYEKIAYANK